MKRHTEMMLLDELLLQSEMRHFKLKRQSMHFTNAPIPSFATQQTQPTAEVAIIRSQRVAERFSERVPQGRRNPDMARDRKSVV